MSFIDSDINFSYAGGSGGFLLLHLLLLENKHDIEFNYKECHGEKFFSLYPEFKNHLGNISDIPEWRDFIFKEKLETQWNITDASDWKSHELWMTNRLDFVPRQGRYKLFFSTNDINEWKIYPGKKLYLYTDARTQVRMALKKRANWFFKRLNGDRYMNISSIKRILNTKVKFNDMEVIPDVCESIALAEKHILLQDLILDPVATLGISNTVEQQELINRWTELHKKFKLYDKIMKGHI